jgi:hypothetical protein
MIVLRSRKKGGTYLLISPSVLSEKPSPSMAIFVDGEPGIVTPVSEHREGPRRVII